MAQGQRIHLQCRRHRRHGFKLRVGESTLEEEMTTHSRILAWKIPCQQSLSGYSSWGCKESQQQMEHKGMGTLLVAWWWRIHASTAGG